MICLLSYKPFLHQLRRRNIQSEYMHYEFSTVASKDIVSALRNCQFEIHPPSHHNGWSYMKQLKLQKSNMGTHSFLRNSRLQQTTHQKEVFKGRWKSESWHTCKIPTTSLKLVIGLNIFLQMYTYLGWLCNPSPANLLIKIYILKKLKFM